MKDRSAAPPSSACARSRISAAALFVNVTATIARGSAPASHEVRQPVRDDARLAGARARQDEERPLRVEDRLSLLGVEAVQGSRMSGFRSSEFGFSKARESIGFSNPRFRIKIRNSHSTVTDLARFRGWSTSHPRRTATWYARSWSGTTERIGCSSGIVSGTITTWSAIAATSASGRVPSTIAMPSRDLTSRRFESVFSRQRVVGREHDDRHVLVDQRDRAVLHLARRVALGVDVGDLLELQRPFEGDRVVEAAAEEEEVAARAGSAGRAPRARARRASAPADRPRAGARAPAAPPATGPAARPPRAAQLRGEQVEDGELRREGLGRGDADLRAGVRGEDRRRPSRAIWLPGTLTIAAIGDPARRASRERGHACRPSRPTARSRRVSVRSSTTGPAVAELAAVVHLDRDPGHALDQELADQAPRARRCRRRAAAPGRTSRRARATAAANRGRARPSRARPCRRASPRSPSGCSWISFSHEVAVAALLGRHRVPEDAVDRRGRAERPPASTIAGRRRRPPAPRRRPRGRSRRASRERAPRGPRRRSSRPSPSPSTIGGPERAATSTPGSPARGDERRRRRPSACDTAAPHRREQVALEGRLDLVGEDLGVRLAREAVPGGRERDLALGEVLEDAVVDDDDLARAVGLGVGVQLGRAPVRGPARVADAGRARATEIPRASRRGCRACRATGGW